MGAPKGNKYYLFAETTGREKEFTTPEMLWDAFIEYTEYVKSNPIIKIDFRGKDADEIRIPLERPLTLSGLADYLGMTLNGLKNYGKLDSHKDYFTIYARIENKCYTDKFDGATVGVYNANIIARDLGLKEHTNMELNGGVSITPKEWIE